MQALVKEGLRSYIIVPRSKEFDLNFPVTRTELAEAIVRTGMIPQYIAGSRMYDDVKEVEWRNVIESAQANPGGKLFFDVGSSGMFMPDEFASRLVAAVAMVKAAGLESQAASSTLPLSVSDRNAIPSQWRGHVAVALQKGWMNLNGVAFEPNRALTRAELFQLAVKAARY